MDGDDELSSSPHLIYHPSSPGFDIPDYLPLRRVKPLPKRKHTSSSSPDLARSLPLNTTTTMLPPILPPPPGPDATAEELIAHAEVLSAQITFQSYFLPTLTGVTDFTTTTTTASSRNAVDMPLSVNPSSPAELLDDVTPLNNNLNNEERENDHMDQTQQQGNAKKRKVPAHLSGLQMGPDSADVHSGEEGKKQQPGGERVPPSFSSPATSAAMASPEEELFQVGAEGGDGHQGKLLPATMVGLRKKQVLKHRRRQLAGLLGSLSLGDSLALDQALLANYTLVNEKRSGSGGGGSSSSIGNARHKSRLIRRRASRVVRRHRTLPPRPPSEPTRRIFPDSEFTFLSSNAASERLIATRAEYTVLCDRFEHEIEQQREKDVESAKESTTTGVGLGGSGSGSGSGSSGDGATTVAKRNEPAMRKARTTTQTVQDTETPGVSKSPSSAKTSGKKKKRSALANASNPHHLRNYVPSRIPNQGLLSAAQLGANTQNMLNPLPLVFLSAQIPPRRGTAQRPPAMASQLTSQGEEWICPTCEYRLFYGDEQGYRMGVRNRKKILKRRRRARERAAAAANGSGTGVGIHGKGSGFDDEEDLDIERTGSGLALSERRLASVERDKGGGDREEREEAGAAG